jgi:hypothetical protein
MAHKNPEQLGHLIQFLNCKDSAIYLHLDKRSRISDFKDVISKLSKHVNLTLLPRVDTYWRGPGIVTATLNGLDKVLKDKIFNRIVLLSGQDYPIKSSGFICDFFSKNFGNNFISSFKLPYSEWNEGGLTRINNYHFRLFGRTYIYPPVSDPVHPYSKLFYRIAKIRFGKPREFPKGLIPYGGFSNWQITADAAKEILEFIDKRPDYLKFHKYSWVADEMFFQTILLNSKNEELVNSIINNDLTFFKRLKNKSQSEILLASDFEEIKNSDKLFARKFDSCIDSKILEMIDLNIHSIDRLTISDKCLQSAH